jgi:tellurite resistance protein TerB
MFGFLKRAAVDNVNKYSGNKDFLEACAAAAARVAAADGSIDEDEIVAAVEAIQAVDSLKTAYSPAEIEEAVMKQFGKAKSIMGRNALKRELQDVALKDINLRQDVFLVGASAAEAVGGIGDEERAALNDVAKILGVNSQELLAA